MLAVAEKGALLDEHFNAFRVFGKVAKIGADAGLNAQDGIRHRFRDLGDVLMDATHHPVSGGKEQFFLAAKVAIKGSLANIEGVGEQLQISFAVALAGEKADGLIKNCFPPVGSFRLGFGQWLRGFHGKKPAGGCY